MLFSSSVNRLIRNFLVIVAVLFGIRALMFIYMFTSYLEGYEPGFLHADFVSSSNSK